MEEAVFKIALMNRVKPVAMEGYVKQPKPPRRIRECYMDHLNVFKKEIYVTDSIRFFIYEQERLNKETPWLVAPEDKASHSFGYTIIGKFFLEGEPDYSMIILIKTRNT